VPARNTKSDLHQQCHGALEQGDSVSYQTPRDISNRSLSKRSDLPGFRGTIKEMGDADQKLELGSQQV
jgi:hypothetical protein